MKSVYKIDYTQVIAIKEFMLFLKENDFSVIMLFSRRVILQFLFQSIIVILRKLMNYLFIDIYNIYWF